MYMSDKGRSEPKDSEMLQILKTKQKKEIAMKKRKSYAELKPVKKKLWRGFVIITLMLKTKRKTAKTYNTVSHVFKKKKKSKGRARLHMFCLVFGQLPH